MTAGASITTPSAGTLSPEPDSRAGKYLAFCLGTEEFAVPVQKVREIIGVPEITFVPHTPAYVKGVVNLRGKVVPVIDLRLRLGMQSGVATERSSVVIMQVIVSKGSMMLGALVDAVSEVVQVHASDIEETAQFGDRVNSHVLGLAKIRDRVKILLDMDQVMSSEDGFLLDAPALTGRNVSTQSS